MIEIECVPKESVAEVWPHIEKWVESSLGEDESLITEDIKNICCAGKFDLWLIYNDELTGFLIASVYDTPQMKACYAPWLGGKDLESWVKEAFEQFKAHLRTIGCEQYSFIGRKAWQKLISADYQANFYLIKL